MITEDYVSFETAKLLKERGFDCECHRYFWIAKDGNAILDYSYSEMDSNADMLYYSAPTLQMAMKWLREVHKIFIRVIQSHIEYCACEIYYGIVNYYNFIESFASYEEACEAAIKYCLENLI